MFTSKFANWQYVLMVLFLIVVALLMQLAARFVA